MTTKKWKGLTDDEIIEISGGYGLEFARVIEQKLKEKNSPKEKLFYRTRHGLVPYQEEQYLYISSEKGYLIGGTSPSIMHDKTYIGKIKLEDKEDEEEDDRLCNGN